MQKMFVVGVNVGFNGFQQFIPQPRQAYGAYVGMPCLDTLRPTSLGAFESVGALAVGAFVGQRERNKKRRGRKAPQQLERATAEATQADSYSANDFQTELDAPSLGVAADLDSAIEDQSRLELIQSCREQLDGNEMEQKEAIGTIQDHMLDLAFGQQGCRLVQEALEKASQKGKTGIAAGLQGQVVSAAKSPHANYVLQKLVEVLPTTMTSFVAEELLDIAGEVARHRYGCRIICRLLEHAAEPSTDNLVNAILCEAKDLSSHAFGHIVMRSILEHGSFEQRARVADALRGQLEQLAKRKHASFVVEKALASCDQDIRATLANELLQDPSAIIRLAQHQFGHHIVTELARTPGDCAQKLLHIVHNDIPHLDVSKHGKRCLKALGMRK